MSNDSEDRDQCRDEMAENRTDWAEDRTVLANERTFSSRMGLALGSLGLAIGLQGVFREAEPTWVAKAVASIFVFIAMYVTAVSYRNSKAMHKRLSSHSAEPVSTNGLFIIAAVSMLGCLGVLLVLWIS